MVRLYCIRLVAGTFRSACWIVSCFVDREQLWSARHALSGNTVDLNCINRRELYFVYLAASYFDTRLKKKKEHLTKDKDTSISPKI